MIRMTEEIWKSIPGYEAYEVSNLGHVLRVAGGRGTRPMKAINPTKDSGGRMVFNVRGNGKTRQMKLHRAVMLAFCGECPDGYEVAHKDGDTEHNALSNLIYATPTENNRHKALHGTQPMGTQVYNAKLTDSDVIEIREAWPAESYAKLGKRFGVHFMTIAQVVQRRTWKHL